MKRLVIDARESGTSTGRYVDKLIQYLHQLKPEFEVIILTKSHRLQFMRDVAPNFQVVKSDFKEFSFAEQLGFNKQLKSLKANLVHFTMPQQPVLYKGKKVTTIHDLTTTRFRNPDKNQFIFLIKQLVFKWVLKRVARKSSAVIVPSTYVKNDVAKYARIKRNKIYVTYEAAERIRDYPRLVQGLSPRAFILYVGRPLPHKNLRRLMEAYSIIRNTRDGFKLALVGDGDRLYKRHQAWAKKEHIEGLVFTGKVSEGQLRWLYENTLAFVFPSLSEGFGLPGLEAMAHGAPVVSSNATALPEIYGGAAEYFNPDKIHEMFESISNVAGNPKRAHQLRQLGNLQVKKYSWERMARQTLEIYSNLLNK